tara:strand:- start:4465 stop:5040 length:576 start_codon:yes stop_codon:yes gene_type:complete
VNRNSNRFKASIIFLTPILVLVMSTLFFFFGYSPEGTVNKGTLISPPIDLKKLELKVNAGPLQNEFPGKWTVVQFVMGECYENCWQTLYTSRQIDIRLSKDSSRLERYLISLDAPMLSDTSLKKITKEYPELNLGTISSNKLPKKIKEALNKSPYVLFDPLGNGILIYDITLPSGELLQDLKKLLQNSKIG